MMSAMFIGGREKLPANREKFPTELGEYLHPRRAANPEGRSLSAGKHPCRHG